MLQRQIMFKQLEELQRQKKLKELNDSRQENVISQQSSFIHNNKQASFPQSTPLINGTPVRDPSQMFMFANTNLVQGFQNGSPFSQPGHGFTRFSNFQHEQQIDTVVNRSSSMSGEHQFSNVGYQEQGEIQTDTNQEFTSLDPMEQKFLFNSDDNNFGSMFEDTDNNSQLQSFPSLQSGSWSALMQSALDETSSTDTGIQEEWSGLSFQNPEPSIDTNNNQPPNIIESRKWQMQNNMFQQVPVPSTHFQFKSDSSHGSNKEGDSSGMSAVMDKSTGFSVQDSNAQTSGHMLELFHKVDKFREYNKHGNTTTTSTINSTLTESTQSQSKIPKAETTSNTSSVPQSFGLKTQRLAGNYFDSSQISQQMATSILKNQEGQQGLKSKSQPNVWIDIQPSNQNLSSRIETGSEGQKESTEGVINSQTFDYGRGQDGKFQSGEESFSGRVVEANGSISLKQSQPHISPHGYSPLNPTYSGVGVKKERLDSSFSDPKLPQITSMSALASAYENYKTVLTSSKGENPLVKSPFYPSFQDPSQIHKNSSFVQMNLANTSQFVNQDSIISKSKKRKFPTFELLPWHKEATEGSRRLHDTSIVEQEWGHAANRVPEKMMIEGGNKAAIKKRIILTTQLMQVLFRAVPNRILLDDAMECYDMVTYLAARLALGDACSLTNHLSSGKKGSADQNLSKIVEDFVDRSNKIEDALLRLESNGSVLEIRMKSQDLERFSVINRFAKFHSRAQVAVAAETTTTTTSGGVPKLYPQRYVIASQMPRVVPEGHNCLSL